MSVQTLYTAATGMEALQTKLDVIANNLANVNTDGFKRSRANFEDLMYRDEVIPGATDDVGNRTAIGTQIGLGTRVSGTQGDFRQGAFQSTGRELDVLIEGHGFLQVGGPNGETLYTRAGHLNQNANGSLVIGSASDGYLLEPAIQLPPDTVAVEIASNGDVQIRQPGTQDLQTIGSIELATFPNPGGLLRVGNNLYKVTDASGQATQNTPGTNGTGVLRHKFLEASNVEPVQELIDLITTQRSFELNSQAVQAGDQLLQQIANLRRF